MAVPREDFKWFGEGFEGFPKLLPENCVEYSLFLIHPTRDPAGLRARLDSVVKAANDVTQKTLQEYIWQRESFSLEISSENDLTFLRGRTDYGDAVEDEWLIVYLLVELTKRFEDLWVKVTDSDGQFLLVEAAKTLPQWLNPEIAENRVWLHQGGLFIIPLCKDAEEQAEATSVARPLSLEEGLHEIETHHKALLHSALIESEAFYRLRNYPEQIAKNIHCARAAIPRKLAYILHQHPEHISPAVDAFYLRDPIAMRPLQITAAEGGRGVSFPPEDLVTVSVRFTKVGYAQLKGQQFAPPPLWTGVLPEEVDPKASGMSETGMKVTCAFEMLVADPQSQGKEVVKSIRSILSALDKRNVQLPSNEEIKGWNGGEDDESWLDVNFEDFERELSGGGGKSGSKGTGKGASTFRDDATQENLRKMVERFEDFLNDDAAGADGAEVVDDMDVDDDDDEDDDDEGVSSGEDVDVSFDEREFARMMREMMGMPADDGGSSTPTTQSKQHSRVTEVDPEDDVDEMRNVMRRMEAELTEAGAYTGTAKDYEDKDEEVDDTEEVNIDYTLAKNLLESFKSQAGVAGPTSNLMGLMGMKMPRDEGDEDDADKAR